jgi:hypothetical protein
MLVEYLLGKFKESGTDLSSDHMAIQRIWEAAEKAKIELSSTSQTEINLPFMALKGMNPTRMLTPTMAMQVMMFSFEYHKGCVNSLNKYVKFTLLHQSRCCLNSPLVFTIKLDDFHIPRLSNIRQKSWCDFHPLYSCGKSRKFTY